VKHFYEDEGRRGGRNNAKELSKRTWEIEFICIQKKKSREADELVFTIRNWQAVEKLCELRLGGKLV